MQKEKGVSLIITFFIMAVALAVVLAISTILYSEIKIIRNMSNSVAAFYVADSANEKVLYYDRKQILQITGSAGSQVPAPRGLCSICSNCSENSQSPTEENCNNCTATAGVNKKDQNYGCDIDKCDDCQITFKTDFGDEKSAYDVVAKSYVQETDTGELLPAMDVDAVGTYKNVSRKTNMDFSNKGASVLAIKGITLTLSFDPFGIYMYMVNLGFEVVGSSIQSVDVYLYDNYYDPPSLVEKKNLGRGPGKYSYQWVNLNWGSYFVKIVVTDESGKTVEAYANPQTQ